MGTPITFAPLATTDLHQRVSFSGSRWADTTLTDGVIPKASSFRAAPAITARSESLPMIIATVAPSSIVFNTESNVKIKGSPEANHYREENFRKHNLCIDR
eukprot:680557_1